MMAAKKKSARADDFERRLVRLEAAMVSSEQIELLRIENDRLRDRVEDLEDRLVEIEHS